MVLNIHRSCCSETTYRRRHSFVVCARHAIYRCRCCRRKMFITFNNLRAACRCTCTLPAALHVSSRSIYNVRASLLPQLCNELFPYRVVPQIVALQEMNFLNLYPTLNIPVIALSVQGLLRAPGRSQTWRGFFLPVVCLDRL